MANKTVLITGASSGIGKAAAILFQKKGWNVVATMRNPQNETELSQLDNLLLCRLDVTDLASIDEAISQALNHFGSIDLVVNNAGYGAYGPLEVFPRENIIRQFNTNVIGLLDVTRAAIPVFRKQKRGMFINISSIGGKVTFPLGSLYHGTKFAVEGISEALAFELKEIGVQIKIVEPGAIATDFAGRSFDFHSSEKIEEYQQMIAKVMQAMEPLFIDASPASLAAEVIYTAATDGKEQLRYAAGPDAVEILKKRKDEDDSTFTHSFMEMFGLN